MPRKRCKVTFLTRPSKSERTAILDFHNRNFPNSKWSDRSFEKYFLDTRHHPFCTAIKTGKNFHGIAIGRFSTNSRSSLNLATMLVSQKCRGKGYGDALMEEFFRSAAKITSMRKIHLHFRDSNSQVESFYKRFGFKKRRTRETYSNGEKKNYMEISRKSIQRFLSNFDPCQK